jgi:hypothetical protein
MAVLHPAPGLVETRVALERAGDRCAALTEELADARRERDRLVVEVAQLGLSRRESARAGGVSLSSVQQTLERSGVVPPVPSRRHRYLDGESR